MGSCLTFHVDQRLPLNRYGWFYWQLKTDYTDDKQIDPPWCFYTATSSMTFIKNSTTDVRPVTTVYTSACCEVLIITYSGIKGYLFYLLLTMDFCVYLHNVVGDNVLWTIPLSLIHWKPTLWHKLNIISIYEYTVQFLYNTFEYKDGLDVFLFKNMKKITETTDASCTYLQTCVIWFISELTVQIKGSDFLVFLFLYCVLWTNSYRLKNVFLICTYINYAWFDCMW